jgi:hypothetical protein
VSYEYYLEPAGDAFGPDAGAEMRRRLECDPAVHGLDESTYLVFQDEGARGDQLPEILAHPARNYYGIGQVVLTPSQVMISAVNIAEIDRRLYDFTSWALRNFEAKLYEGDREVPPEEILPRG